MKATCRDCGLDVPATTGKIPMRKEHGCRPNPGYIRRAAYERARSMVEGWRNAETDAGGRLVTDAEKLKRLSEQLQSLAEGQESAPTSEAAPAAPPNFSLSMETRGIVICGEAFVVERALNVAAAWADLSEKLEALGIRVTRLDE